MKVNKLSAKMYHLTLIVALGIASLFVGFRVEPDAATVATVPVEATEMYAEAARTIGLLNDYRSQNNRPPLILDAKLTQIAMTRAFELFVIDTHVRPNGTSVHTMLDANGFDSTVVTGEVVAISNLFNGDAANVGLSMFMESSAHASIIKASDFTRIGIGIAYMDNVGYSWCYILTNRAMGQQGAGASANKKTVKNIEVDDRYTQLNVYPGYPSPITEYGHTATVRITAGGNKLGHSATIPNNALTFSSSNPSIVNINATTGAYSVVGTGSVTITAKLKNNASVAGAWQGTISRADLSFSHFSVLIDGKETEIRHGNALNPVWYTKDASDFPYQYRGSEIKPKVTVKDRTTGNALTQGRDYTVSYSHTKNTGMYSVDSTITITGKGNYTGSKTRYFQILPQEQSSGNAGGSSNNSNNGGYVNNDSSSAGNSTSSGSTASGGNTSGGTTKPSQAVKPGNTTNGSVKVTLKAPTVSAANSSKGITVRWKDSSEVQGYRIYRRSGKGKWTKIATVGANVRSYVDRKAKNGTLYYYTVRGYYGSIQSGYNKTGYNKTGKAAYRLTNIRLSSLKNNKARSVVVKWKKNAKATGYQVQYSTNKSFRKAKAKTIKGGSKSSYTLTRMVKGKTCYVRVRAYYSRKGVRSYTAWSAAKAVRIRK